MNGLILMFLLVIGLFIFYFVIYTAVKDGINKSVIGQYLENKHNFVDKQKPFIHNDLDKD